MSHRIDAAMHDGSFTINQIVGPGVQNIVIGEIYGAVHGGLLVLGRIVERVIAHVEATESSKVYEMVETII